MGYRPIPPRPVRNVVEVRGQHPRDVWVDVTAFGDTEPRLMLAVDGREMELAELREAYAHDRLTIEELERRVGEVLA